MKELACKTRADMNRHLPAPGTSGSEQPTSQPRPGDEGRSAAAIPVAETAQYHFVPEAIPASSPKEPQSLEVV